MTFTEVKRGGRIFLLTSFDFQALSEWRAKQRRNSDESIGVLVRVGLTGSRLISIRLAELNSAINPGHLNGILRT